MKLKTLLFAALIFAACGDDSSSGPAPENTPGSSVLAQLSSSGNGKSAKESSSSVAKGKSSSIEKNAASSSSVSAKLSSSSVEKSSSSVKASLPANYDAATHTVTDERDGKKYKTATIGSQTWLAQNMAYALTKEDREIAFMCPNDEWENCSIYGNLYNQWGFGDALEEGLYFPAFPDSVRPYKGICPTGWHIPSLDEWQVLLSNATVQDLLAESVGGTGKSGFDVVFAGMSGSSGIELFEEAAAFATVDDRDENYMYYVTFTSTSARSGTTSFGSYVSVRCLMD